MTMLDQIKKKYRLRHQSTHHAQESADGSTANHALSKANRVDPWKRKTLLTLDGGGVRGYSSLLILRELMKQIAALEQHHPKGPAPYSVSPLDMRHRPSVTLNHHTKEYGPTRASSHYLPCHYFDYIAGTSTGGLIAIMLGRLSMNVEECIEAYEQLADRVFGHPRHFHLRKPPWIPRDKYNHKNLEDVIKEIVRCRSPEGKSSMLFPQRNEDMCRTIVIAWQKFSLGGVRFPYLMRSYRHPKGNKGNPLERNTGHEDNYHIWEVGRATSAAPLYFKSIHLEEDNEKFELIDGGFGANNPSEEAYRSVQQLHNTPDGAVSVCVSIGTGKNLEHGKNPSKGYRLYLKYVNAAAKWATDSEKTHETVSFIMARDNAKYVRLNVEHGIGKMKLDAWKGRRGIETLDLLRDKTDSYLLTEEARREIVESANHLVNARRLRSDVADPEEFDHWERYCHGVEYACSFDDCEDPGRRYTRRDLQRHLKETHTCGDRSDIHTKLESGKRFPLYDFTG